IEVPARSVRPAKRAAVPLFAGAAALAACALAIFIQQANPLSAHYGVQRILRAAAERAFAGPHLEVPESDSAEFPVHRAARAQALFMGDSNMEQYYPRIDRLLTGNPAGFRSAVFATGGGCPPIPGVHENHHPYCDGLIERAIEYARNPRVDTIVIAAAWHSYFVEPDERYSYYFQDQDFVGGLTLGSEGSRRA